MNDTVLLSICTFIISIRDLLFYSKSIGALFADGKNILHPEKYSLLAAHTAAERQPASAFFFPYSRAFNIVSFRVMSLLPCARTYFSIQSGRKM